MEFVVGVDGGGVKTEAVVASIEGEVLGVGYGGAANINIASRSVVEESLRKAIQTAISRAGVSGKALLAVLGIAGTERKRCSDIIWDIARKLDFSERLIITSDALIALAAATQMKPGIIVISGTGSIALGIDEYGNIARAGGWGYLLDDEGSGYWIGLKALREVMRAYDGRGRNTALTTAVLEHLNLNSIEDLVTSVYSGEVELREIASLSKVVVKCAEMGDEVALKIVDEAGAKLAEMIAAVARKLRFKEKIDLYVFGGVFRAGSLILKPLTQKLGELKVKVELKKPRFKPVIGAIILAIQNLGLDVERTMVNLRRTAKRWGLTYES